MARYYNNGPGYFLGDLFREFLLNRPGGTFVLLLMLLEVLFKEGLEMVVIILFSMILG